MTARATTTKPSATPFARRSTRLSRRSLTLLGEGVAAIAAGVLALAFPDLALLTFVALLAVWAIADGAIAIATGAQVARGDGRSWPFAVAGVASLTAAVLMLAMPAPTLVGLALIVGAWQVATGLLQVIHAYRARTDHDDEAITALSGVARAGFGALVIAMPVFGLQAGVAVFAIDALVTGSIAVATALGARRTRGSVRKALEEKPAGRTVAA
jgi:uncharacterized membrane protein HdeD (DUF308 family)